MKVSHIKAISNADRSADIYLYGVIGDFWFTEDPVTSRAFLKTLSAMESKHDVINIRINSPGGDVFEGLAICNAIRSSKKEIHTYNDGLAASMGAAILLSAKNGNRHAAKASMTMLHNSSTICWGNANDLRDTAESLDVVDETLSSIIMDASGLTMEEVTAKWMQYKDNWLTAAQAAKDGLVTVEDYKAEPVPENLAASSMDQIAAFYHPKFNAQSSQIQNPNMKFENLIALAGIENPTAEQIDLANAELTTAGVVSATIVAESSITEAANVSARVAQITTELEIANTALATAQAELATAQGDLATATTAQATSNATIAALTAKVEAFGKNAGATHRGKPAEGEEQPDVEENDVEALLANMPHNRQADTFK